MHPLCCQNQEWLVLFRKFPLKKIFLHQNEKPRQNIGKNALAVASMFIQAGKISDKPLIFDGNLIPSASENAPPTELPTKNGGSKFFVSIKSTIAAA